MQENSKEGYGWLAIIGLIIVFCMLWKVIMSNPLFFRILLSIGLAIGGILWGKKLRTTRQRELVAAFVLGLIGGICSLTYKYPKTLPIIILVVIVIGILWILRCIKKSRLQCEEEERRCKEEARCHKEEQQIREGEERRRRFEEATRKWNERLADKFREIELWSMNSSVILDSNVWMNEGISEPESICLAEFVYSGLYLHDLNSDGVVDKWNDWHDCISKYPFLVLIEVLSSSYCPNAKLFVSGWQLDELSRIRKQSKSENRIKGNGLKFNNRNKASILAVQALRRIEKMQMQSPSRIEVEDVHAWPNIRAYLDAFLINKAKSLGKSGAPLTVVTNDRDLRIRLRGVAGDSGSVSVLDRADIIQLLTL